jgi:hypothetical protein
MLTFLHRFLICSILVTSASYAKDSEKKAENFQVPASTLEAIDRKLKVENDSQKRIQLILRWVKAKEDYEQAQLEKKKDGSKNKTPNSEDVSQFKDYKEVILQRLSKEITQLETRGARGASKLDPLYHVYAFRLLELQKHAEALAAFNKLSARTADDWMGLGDVYFAMGDAKQALDAYEHGGLALKFKNTAAYKRAWCFLQMTNPKAALAEFDIALEENAFTSIKLREEAYRDRLRPYVEIYAKSDFDLEEMDKLRALATRVYPNQPARAKELLVSGLKNLITDFNSKAQVHLARGVFSFLSKEMADPTSVLVLAAPLWIKVYRGQLNHEEVEIIVKALPNKKIDGIDTSALQAEIYNSIIFYETLFKEDSLPATRKILFDMNKKFFQLFPDEATSDPLRVTYAKLLLEDGDPSECIQILSHRKGMAKDVEEIAVSVDAKCQLKQLDQLYQQPHDEFFYVKLKQTLIDKKIYERSDLGLSSESAFESLSRMLIGALNKNQKMPYLRDILARLIAGYPYSRDTNLFSDLEILSAELQFDDILNSKDSPEDRADHFFGVFEKAPRRAEVSKKALVNSITIAKSDRVLARCDIFAKIHGEDFAPGKEVFDRCIRLAEQYLAVEKEYLYWVQVEGLLSPSQLLKMGLIELALGKGKGKKRLAALKIPEAKSAIELWDGPRAKEAEKESPKLSDIAGDQKHFYSGLKPILFAKIKTIVPAKIKAFEAVDAQLTKFLKSKPNAVSIARALEMRAELATHMATWIKDLPEPSGLSSEDLKQYRAKTAEFIKSWEDGAIKRSLECGESAHSIAVEYKVTNRDVCPERTPSEVTSKFLEKWEATRQRAPAAAPWKRDDVAEKGVTVGFLLDAGQNAKDKDQAKYFYIRALDLSASNYDRAHSYLALAKLTDNEVFWQTAYALDGNLLEPIQWLRNRATGNLFFERLYDTLIQKVK